MSNLIAMGMAVVVGIFIGVQPAINGHLAKVTSVKLATLMSLTTSFVLIVLYTLFSGGVNFAALKNVNYFYIVAGGIMGFTIVSFSAKIIPILGSTITISIFVAVQLIASVIIDHFGIFGLEKSPLTIDRIIGVSLLLIGLRFILK